MRVGIGLREGCMNVGGLEEDLRRVGGGLDEGGMRVLEEVVVWLLVVLEEDWRIAGDDDGDGDGNEHDDDDDGDADGDDDDDDE